MLTYEIHDEKIEANRVAQISAVFSRARWVPATSGLPDILIVHQTDLSRKDQERGTKIAQGRGLFIRFGGGSVRWEASERKVYGPFDELMLRLGAWASEADHSIERLWAWMTCDITDVDGHWQSMAACAVMCSGFLMAHAGESVAARTQVLQALGIEDRAWPSFQSPEGQAASKFAHVTETADWWRRGCGELRPAFHAPRCLELAQRVWPEPPEQGAEPIAPTPQNPSIRCLTPADMGLVASAYCELADLLSSGGRG
jgi:hypothetical protein